MNDFLQLFLLSLLGSIVALAGGVIFLFSGNLSKTLEKYSVPFAAGVLLVVSLLGLLPEAVHFLDERAFLVVLITFVTAYLFENFLFKVHHHADDDHSHKSAVPLVILGDTIHNLIDGVAIATSFIVNPGLGLITALSTFLHEVPHEISDFGLLLRAGWKKPRVLFVNLISASTTILGAFMVYFFTPGESLTGTLLAVSAGLFLYLGASDFLPSIKHHPKKEFLTIGPFLLGVLIMIASLYLIPHTHEEEALESETQYGEVFRNNPN